VCSVHTVKTKLQYYKQHTMKGGGGGGGGSIPRIELRTSCTQGKNHTTRPNALFPRDVSCRFVATTLYLLASNCNNLVLGLFL
jgi:hypothetical protein